MTDLNSISKDIGKKKNLDKNLSAYVSNMMTLYSRFSHIKLSMKCYTFCDVLSEKEDALSKEVAEELLLVTGIIEENLVNNSDEATLQSAVKRLEEVRSSVTNTMEVVTAYVDRFAIFEHILNRLEFKFADEELDEEYYDNRLVADIMNYILSDRDSVVMNGKIAEVVGQLPMRLTRQKFFELVKDAVGLYNGQDKSSLKDFVYMLETISGIYEPEGFKDKFADLNEIYDKLTMANYKEMSREEFAKAQDSLQYAVSFLTRASDLYVQLMEIINDTLIILLSKPYAFGDSEEQGNCLAVIKSVMNQEGGNLDDLDEDITDKFISFEGKQERIYSQISSNDYLIDEMERSFAEELDKFELTKAADGLKKIAKLASGSYFVSLDNADIEGTVSESDAEEAFAKYHDTMAKVFAENKKDYNRAVMSAVLASLPVFFNNLDEIQNYVRTSLEQCSEEAEKKACVALIRLLVDENYA